LPDLSLNSRIALNGSYVIVHSLESDSYRNKPWILNGSLLSAAVTEVVYILSLKHDCFIKEDIL
jgi:hypothetical protein